MWLSNNFVVKCYTRSQNYMQIVAIIKKKHHSHCVCIENWVFLFLNMCMNENSVILLENT